MQRPNYSSENQQLAIPGAFYCRMRNRVREAGCPLTAGPRTCPVRNECPAHAMRIPASPTVVPVVHA